ncbi:hypothetical protein ScPMuIL_015217, partial [Solemya velum]
TLRDRILGKVDPECVTTGRSPLFSLEEEEKIVQHLKSVAQYGYGYTRSEVADIATDFALALGKRKKDEPLTRNWMDGFLRRWPELRVLRPRSLEIARAKSASEAVVRKYFEELQSIIQKYDLEEQPHLVFNVDEKGVSPNHTPPSIIALKGTKPPAVVAGKSQTTTIIGCGSASGTAIPPFFVFAGKKWNNQLLEGGTPGCSGTIYNICEISCKVYNRALCHENLISGFRKTGIFPTDPNAIDNTSLLPSEIFHVEEQENEGHHGDDHGDDHGDESNIGTNKEQDGTIQNISHTIQELDESGFFSKKLDAIKAVKSAKKRTRKSVSKIVSGKPITEENIEKKIREYEADRNSNSKKSKLDAEDKSKAKRKSQEKFVMEPHPGPSNIVSTACAPQELVRNDTDTDSEDECEITEEEKCCVCHKFTPD